MGIRVWFIRVGEEETGPFTPGEIKDNPLVNLDTLVRRKNWVEWFPLRDVAQLKKLFNQEKEDQNESFESKDVDKKKMSDVLTLSLEPKNIFWLLLLILLLMMLYLGIVLYK
jgi:hypothetical protein